MNTPPQNEYNSDVETLISSENLINEIESKSGALLLPTVAAMELPSTHRAAALNDGRERLKRHRVEVAGRVWVPDMWGQEDLLKDWIDCAAFDSTVTNSSIVSAARAALVDQGRRRRRRRNNSTSFRLVQNSC